MEKSDLPTSLETLEDYHKAATSFVLPFLQERSIKIADTLLELYGKVDRGEKLTQEDTDFFLSQFREAVSFADEKNPTNRYFQKVMELEQRLDEEGQFDVEESSVET